MAFGYLVVALIVVGMNVDKIPLIFGSVLQEAFNFEAILVDLPEARLL